MTTRAALGEITECESHAEAAGRVWAQWEVLLQAAHVEMSQWDRTERVASIAAPLVRTAMRTPRAALPRMDVALRGAVRGQHPQEGDTILAVWERLLDGMPPLPVQVDDADAWTRGWVTEHAALDPRRAYAS